MQNSGSRAQGDTQPAPEQQADPQTGAEALLRSLRRNGVTYLFSNSGTDFPPIIEAMARLDPESQPVPLLVPHETAGVAMAHGYYLMTGAPQAVMVHVNVGLANSVMGMINAASDDIPVLMMSGRTPITETGREGCRATPIQYGQEMYDQSSLVRDVAKFTYEMRYPEQGDSLVTRALTLAASVPAGPVYLSLPREPLGEVIPPTVPPAPAQVRAEPAAPDPAAIARLAEWISAARAPLILTQRGDTGGRSAAALARLADRHAIAVAEPFSIRNVMATDHPMFQGHDPKPAIAGADLIIVLDSGVPWIEATHSPAPGVRVAHIGPDPLFRRMPVRGYRNDLAIVADPAAALDALDAALGQPGPHTVARRASLSARSADRRTAARAQAQDGATSPMTAEWLSHCLSDIMDDRAVIFGELGVVPGAMRLKGPNRMFNNPHSGGLGWGLPAALGAQLADRDRLVIACIGDGSYMFANPVACHQIAEALRLPVLTIIKNNGMWNAVRRSVVNAYPGGAAARMNTMPLTSLEPAPDYLMVAAASRAHTERVTDGADLPAALDRALRVIREERRQAVLDVAISVSDRH
ncbi:thiamine pyrophosphate-requiring protein [Halodurantibacterium flavum]|uniref:Thiamine pyrophosphate-requiring protein n=1 Tax=Halodurantibacterium flavum TaxID=1382802 RepID=A0ABW4S0S1_9RHOB